MHRFRLRAGWAALAVVLVAAGCKWTGFNDPAARSAATSARNWLVTQQQAGGGFEVSGFDGFETPDAILAIAEEAQQQVAWNKGQARTAVKAVKISGKSATNWADDFADGALTAGQAAKLVALVAKPLGYSVTSFNPDGDAGVRDLLATIDAAAQPDGSYGAFNATLYAALAKRLVNGSVPASTLAYIRAAQEASGGWNYAADSSGAFADVDTTSLAIQALVAAKVARTDTDLVEGVQYLADQHRASGAWQSFGSDDPNSTSTAILAITAIGENPAQACWRDRAARVFVGTPYSSPVAWLGGQVASDGHIASPNDAFPPVNTFATSQGIQALRRGWLPAIVLNPLTCP